MKNFLALVGSVALTVGLAAIADPNMSASALWGKPTALEAADLSSGALIETQPLQVNYKTVPNDREMKGYTLKHLASFSLDAVVLSKKNYNHGREADLSPTDLALGWGIMSDPAFLQDLRITQGRRFYYWRYGENKKIRKRQVINNSSNMHIIPGNANAERILKQVREGDSVTLRGYLVNVRAKDGWGWNSSLVRTDTGAGACELFLVESISIDTGHLDGNSSDA